MGQSQVGAAGIALLENYLALVNEANRSTAIWAAAVKAAQVAPPPALPTTAPLPLIPFGPALIEWERQNKAIDEASKKLKELTDRLSGGAAVQSLDRLLQSWKSLTPALRESAAAQDHFLDEYVKLSPELVKVPPRLAAVVSGLNKMAMAAGKFSADKIIKGL